MTLTPRKQRILGISLMLGISAISLSACGTSNIGDIFTSNDDEGVSQTKVFVPGDVIHCVAKVYTSRSDKPQIDWFLQPLEIAGKRVNLPPIHLDPSGNKTADKGPNVTILRFEPGSAFFAAQYHPSRVVTATNAGDDQAAVALAQDLHDTFIDHLNDKVAHRNGLVDPTIQLVPPNCTKVSNEYDPSNCALMINNLKALFNRHISDATYHVNPDAGDAVQGDDALVPSPPQAGQPNQPPPPLPLVEVSLYPLVNEFKKRMNDHIFSRGGGAGSPQAPGHFRCSVAFDGAVKSTDFAIIPVGAKPPPSDVPAPGTCDSSNVVFCPDPSPGADPNEPTTLVRCCTDPGRSCGKGPANTILCYAN